MCDKSIITVEAYGEVEVQHRSGMVNGLFDGKYFVSAYKWLIKDEGCFANVSLVMYLLIVYKCLIVCSL